VPRAGWQIDPFGHSSTQAALLSAAVGFDSLFFARIDYEDRHSRKASKAMEFIWQASPSMGASSRVWTSVLDPDYGPLQGFCFDEIIRCPMQDDIHDDEFWNNTQVRRSWWSRPDETLSNDYCTSVRGVPPLLTCRRRASMSLCLGCERKRALFKVMISCCRWAATSCTKMPIDGRDRTPWNFPNLALILVCSFNRYRNLDRLIAAVNADGRVHARYSTPDEYAAAKLASNLTWPMKFDDFFPYSSNEHEVWR
jgi:alpha-mannosidase